MIIVFLVSIPIASYADVSEQNGNVLPEYYVEDCPVQGKTELLSINGVRDILVHTPSSYDPSNHYDVILLFHGSGGTLTDWMTVEYDIFNRKDKKCITGEKLYDWMFYENKIEPVIIASIDNNITTNHSDMMKDIHNVYKAIIDNYSTYAASSSDEDFAAAREHFTLGGLSMGSYYAMQYLTRGCDFIGNYMFYSRYWDVDFLKTYFEENKDKRIHNLVIACGVDDSAISTARNVYKELIQYSDNAVKYEYVYGHNWSVWTAAIYDSLIYMYGKEPMGNSFLKFANKVNVLVHSSTAETVSQ